MEPESISSNPEGTEKKRRKEKSSTETSDPLPSTVEPTPGAGITDEPEMPRRREPTKGDAVDANIDAEPSSNSKSRKRKKRETAEDEDHSSTAAPTEDSSRRKRKKSKESPHPKPSDDPDLTEQSQKGSCSHLLKYEPLTSSFDHGSSDLHLLPIYLARNLEIQQSSSKLDNPQCLDIQG